MLIHAISVLSDNLSPRRSSVFHSRRVESALHARTQRRIIRIIRVNFRRLFYFMMNRITIDACLRRPALSAGRQAGRRHARWKRAAGFVSRESPGKQEARHRGKKSLAFCVLLLLLREQGSRSGSRSSYELSFARCDAHTHTHTHSTYTDAHTELCTCAGDTCRWRTGSLTASRKRECARAPPFVS